MKSIKVRGEGNILVKPDKVLIGFQKIELNKNYEEAIRNINLVINKVIEGLKNLGIDENDIKTENFQISTDSKYDDELKENIFTNYRVEHRISIEVDNNSDELNKVLNFLSNKEYSANIDIIFKSSDYEGAREEALIRAISDAKNKADLIAKTLGLRIDSVKDVQYNEEKNNYERINYNNILLEKANNLNFNIIPKDLIIKEFINIEFSIK